MINPKLTPKIESVLTVTNNTKKLFQVIYREQHKEEREEDNAPKIKVSELISKVAFYYEKIRNAVDYKEEHLLRKNAIVRILRRQIMIEGAIVQEVKCEAVAKHLLSELIRAGYLPNNKVPEAKIAEICKVIEKYIKLKTAGFKKTDSQNGREANNYKAKSELARWIMAMLGCDIEERLGRSKVDQVVISNTYEMLSSLVKLPDDSPYSRDKNIQIYITIHRSLLKFDREMVGFIVFKYFNANWGEAGEEDIVKTGENIFVLREAVDKQTDHPLTNQLNLIVRRYAVFFGVLTETIAENPVSVYESFKYDPKAFPRDIKKVCRRKYCSARRKLWRAAARSIIYIFLTKSIFAILLEVPAAKWFGQEVNPVSLAINISFPALLLFLIVLFTRLPSEKNTEKIIAGIDEVIFKEYERKEPIQLREPAKRGQALHAVFNIIYSAAFFFSIGVVVWALDKINFNWVSIVIFLFFLAFVSFFAIRIRKGARELIVIEPKENILTFLSDFFYIPIVAVGKWLSEKFSRVNVFVFIMDFIIEAPFKIFVEIAEEWTKYVRERKEEIV
ncbi:hypothetical protein HY798_00020 [Candidatus Falkowbacteria bacterium]|nr:hypothetical protein [Candidatus Falkowbacteria bacterium]